MTYKLMWQCDACGTEYDAHALMGLYEVTGSMREIVAVDQECLDISYGPDVGFTVHVCRKCFDLGNELDVLKFVSDAV